MTMQEFDDGMTYDSNGFAGDDGLNGNEQTDDAMGGGESPEIKRTGATQTLVPCTVRQITRATQHEDVFLLAGNREIFKVSLVGQVNNLVEQQTSTNFNLMDETGSIGCRMWESEDLPPSEQQKRWRREGSYVKVIAGVKSFADQKRLMVQSVQLIEDMNQISYHLADIILVHLQFLHGVDQPQAEAVTMDLTEMIKQLFGLDQSPGGLGFQDLHAGLESQFGVTATQEDVSNVVNYLLEESILYPGVDEEHWKAC